MKSSEQSWDVDASRAYLRARQIQREQAREHRRQAALQALRRAARSVLPGYTAVRRAYLFGSVLHPAGFGLASDLDLAVEGILSAEEHFALWRDLERAAPGWAIDLIELDRDVHFAQRLGDKGELIYERRD